MLKRTAKEWESSHDGLVTGPLDKECNRVNKLSGFSESNQYEPPCSSLVTFGLPILAVGMPLRSDLVHFFLELFVFGFLVDWSVFRMDCIHTNSINGAISPNPFRKP